MKAFSVALASSKVLPGAGVRELFPIFGPSQTRGRPLSYLDSAATSQKPKTVITRMTRFLEQENANVHRGAYKLSGTATENYEKARLVVSKFIGARSASSVVFTRGTTDSINTVARLLEPQLKSGDTILLSLLEHHSNIVPWQLLAKRVGARVQFIDIDSSGELDLVDAKDKISSLKPKILSITQLSNVLGSAVPVAELTEMAKKVGAFVVVDAAQSVAHQRIDVEKLGVDFLAFSGHKLYGPTGIGILYGREELLSSAEPVNGGGGMISTVSVDGSTWADSPYRFEAGTPPIAEALGLVEAINFVEACGVEAIAKYEDELLTVFVEKLRREAGVVLYGPVASGKPQHAIVSFNLTGVHPHDLATIADAFNVQIRAGHHCAMPLMTRLGVQSTARASIAAYTTMADLDALIGAISHARKKLVG